MDWPIIDARRTEILRLLEQGVEFDRAARLFLAEKYGCSESAILADIERCQKEPSFGERCRRSTTSMKTRGRLLRSLRNFLVFRRKKVT